MTLSHVFLFSLPSLFNAAGSRREEHWEDLSGADVKERHLFYSVSTDYKLEIRGVSFSLQIACRGNSLPDPGVGANGELDQEAGVARLEDFPGRAKDDENPSIVGQ